MPGPAPKDAASRRRRNVPARGEWVDLEPLAKPILDPLPELDDHEWAPNTRLMWEAWRQDPATAFWQPADLAFALDTIMLHNVQSPSDAAEIRLRMTALGLTPKGKRDLRYRVSAKEADVVDIRPGSGGRGRRKLPQQRRLRAV